MRKKIVHVHAWKGDLKRVELACGHIVERSVSQHRPLPKDRMLGCDTCVQMAKERARR